MIRGEEKTVTDHFRSSAVGLVSPDSNVHKTHRSGSPRFGEMDLHGSKRKGAEWMGSSPSSHSFRRQLDTSPSRRRSYVLGIRIGR